MELAKAAGAKRALPLAVSAPFHCSLMTPAAEAMRAALAATTMLAPRAPLVANVSAMPITDPAAIRESLAQQVTGAVRWRESVVYMAGHGVTRFVEIGAGKVLAGLIKRIADGASAISVGTPADVEAYKAL
jgi:[acyl-carrier-protein] S-malonyltransferase